MRATCPPSPRSDRLGPDQAPDQGAVRAIAKGPEPTRFRAFRSLPGGRPHGAGGQCVLRQAARALAKIPNMMPAIGQMIQEMAQAVKMKLHSR